MRAQVWQWASACALIASSFITYASADNYIQVLQPNLTLSFGPLQKIASSAALYGFPSTRTTLTGQVIYPEQYSNPGGCGSYQAFNTEGFSGASLIALIDRGNKTNNCAFSTKVKNAQTAGAVAVIIANDDAQYPGALPLMTPDSGSSSITIPSFIISGADAEVLKANLAATDISAGLTAKLSLFAPAADDRVSLDFFTAALDTQGPGATFRRQWGDVVKALGGAARFQPRYQVRNGRTGQDVGRVCTQSDAYECNASTMDLICGRRCSNCGRYCQDDPDLEPNSGATGGQVIEETARQKCVWLYGNITQGLASTLWFQYVTRFDAECGTDNADPSRWDGSCSSNLLASLNVPSDFMSACTGTLDYVSNTASPVLEDELKWLATYQATQYPQLYVNQQPFSPASGSSLACGDPISPAYCAPLQMACAGYQDGTAPPGACEASCSMGSAKDACGNCQVTGSDAFVTDKSKCSGASNGGGGSSNNGGGGGGSFPTGAVVGIVLGGFLLIAAGVFFYVRRRERAMQTNIDMLLKQYLPMTDVVPNNGAVASRGGASVNRSISVQSASGGGAAAGNAAADRAAPAVDDETAGLAAALA